MCFVKTTSAYKKKCTHGFSKLSSYKLINYTYVLSSPNKTYIFSDKVKCIFANKFHTNFVVFKSLFFNRLSLYFLSHFDYLSNWHFLHYLSQTMALHQSPSSPNSSQIED